MNVPGTIAKDRPPERFVLPQDADSATIGENQICQIEDENVACRLCVDEQAELADIADIELTTNRDHNPWVSRAMNSQHRSDPMTSNAMVAPMGNSQNARNFGPVPRRDFGNW